MLFVRESCKKERVFKIFVSTYQEKVFRWISLFINNQDECAELTSDVFFSLWRKREELERADDLDNYVFTETRNKVLNVLRDQQVNTMDMD